MSYGFGSVEMFPNVSGVSSGVVVLGPTSARRRRTYPWQNRLHRVYFRNTNHHHAPYANCSRGGTELASDFRALGSGQVPRSSFELRRGMYVCVWGRGGGILRQLCGAGLIYSFVYLFIHFI